MLFLSFLFFYIDLSYLFKLILDRKKYYAFLWFLSYLTFIFVWISITFFEAKTLFVTSVFYKIKREIIHLSETIIWTYWHMYSRMSLLMNVRTYEQICTMYIYRSYWKKAFYCLSPPLLLLPLFLWRATQGITTISSIFCFLFFHVSIYMYAFVCKLTHIFSYTTISVKTLDLPFQRINLKKI
jgi:hypothetical protein